jgi:hypothetical protein
VGFKDLVAWSFLMASAHGAGFMLVPVLIRWAAGDGGGSHDAHAAGAHLASHDAAGHTEHAGHLEAVGATPVLGILATAVHTLGYLVVMAIVAVVVYEKFGLAILRKAWFNLDVIWSAALVVTGVVTLVV